MCDICNKINLIVWKSRKWYNKRVRETERKREKETLICCSTYLCIHSLFLVCALTGGWTHNLGIPGWRANHLRYLARIKTWLFWNVPKLLCYKMIPINTSQFDYFELLIQAVKLCGLKHLWEECASFSVLRWPTLTLQQCILYPKLYTFLVFIAFPLQ